LAQYALRRVLLIVPVLAGISFLVFVLVYLIPGDAAQMLLGTDATPAELIRIRHLLGLDRPVLDQYLSYMGNLARFDLGRSLNQDVPVGQLVLGALPATIELAVAAMLIALALGLPLGVLAATRKGSLLDMGSVVFAQLGVSMPAFWLASLLIIVFALNLHWFATVGRGPSVPDAIARLVTTGDLEPLGDTLRHLLLPATTLGLSAAALSMRMVRSTMLEVLQQDYVRTARSKGLAPRVVTLRHALRNALLPVITIVGLQFGTLLGGAIVTESIFAWPGVGRLAITAIGQRDIPVIQGTVLTLAVTFSIINLLVDLSYAWINPKIHYSG
jgi:peptide/nickel transport system permease protein